MGDASLKETQSGHAWILSTGEREHLGDPNMSITGYGAVDGHVMDLSSSRGELQSQTAMTVIAKALLQANDALDIPITLYGDNQGIQTKCSHPKMNKLHHHHGPDSDLMMEYCNASEDLHITHEWVKGHQDKGASWNTIEELKSLDLSNSTTLKIWCDRKAEYARLQDLSDPNVDVYPTEKWAQWGC